MPSLTFDKTPGAEPIAIVRGGALDSQVLYLNSSDGSGPVSRTMPRKEINMLRYEKELRPFKQSERIRIVHRLQEALDKQLPVESLLEPEPVKALYQQILRETASTKEIELPPESIFQPIPSNDPKRRQVYYAAGASGSGKSYFARTISEAYRKLYPDREVWLISKLQVDDTLDNMKGGAPKRINLDSLIEDPPDLEEFQSCLVIFDDFDTLEKRYYDVVHKLIEDLCIMGRHTNTSMLILSHYLTNYSKTRLILGEAQYLVLYPLATSAKALSYVCAHYGGLDPEHVKELKKLGRWVMIHKQYPVYVLSSHHASLPHA